MAKRTVRKSQTEDKPEGLPEEATPEVTEAEASSPSEAEAPEPEPQEPESPEAEPAAERADTVQPDSDEIVSAEVVASESAASEDDAEVTQDAPPEDTAPEVIVPSQPVRVEKRGGAGVALLGGVVGAVIGAGALIYALPNLPPSIAGLLPQATQPVDLQAAFDAKFAEQGKKLDALSEELASLKSAQPPAPDLSGVQSALDQINSEVRANKSAVDDLKSQISNLSAAGGASTDAAQAEIAAAAKSAEERIKQAEEQAQSLKAQSEAAAKAAMAQAAGARVKAALDVGGPIDAALADLRAAGIAVPAALEGEIPSLQSLQASFPDAARGALAEARRADAGGTLSDRVGAFLLAQTGARSVAPKDGNGPDAVLSRAQADVNGGQLSEAIDEIAKLPEAAQAPLADWVAQAKTRVAAIEAANQLGATQ